VESGIGWFNSSEQRRLDELAPPGPAAFNQRQQNADHGIEPGREIDQRNADAQRSDHFDRLLGVPLGDDRFLHWGHAGGQLRFSKTGRRRLGRLGRLRRTEIGQVEERVRERDLQVGDCSRRDRRLSRKLG